MQERADRTRFLGASDIPVLLGLSPYRSVYELWAEKTGRLNLSSNSVGIAASVGSAVEPLIVRWAESKLGKLRPLSADEHLFKIDGTPIIAHPDAITETHEPVEAKTSGLFGKKLEGWGDDGTDEVPDMYYVQMQVQMLACRARCGHLAALLGGEDGGLRLYHIEFDSALASRIVAYATSWWRNYVEKDKEPPGAMAPVEVLSRLKRVPGKRVEIDPLVGQKLIDEYLDSANALRQATERYENAKAAILKELGDAEMALSGEWIITYLERRVKAHYVNAYTYRKLQVVKKKGVRHEPSSTDNATQDN